MRPKRSAGATPKGANSAGKRRRQEIPEEDEASGDASINGANGVDEPEGPEADDMVLDEPDENEEMDDFDLSQRRDFDCTPSAGGEAEVGIIEEVTLRNFMCHNFLNFKFRPQVNFVIGRNGSGKSAVLTAIVVGLGGKANVTNRGTSVKGFIKDGCSTAVVTVKLRNQGTDAFKPDIYGPSIIVERRLSKEGGTSYKIKNSEGKTMSNKREELNHIIDTFNIQVDNPVSVLNQDTSRNFLHSKNASDKYKFFLKATQLEQLKYDYVVANDSKEFAVNVLRHKQETMPILEQEVLDLEEQYKASCAVSGLNDKVARLKDEQAWAIIIRDERAVEQSLRELNTEEARLPKYIAAIEKHENELKDCRKQRTGLHEQIQESMTEGLELEPKHREARSAVNDAKATFRTAQMEERRVLNEHRTQSKEHKAILDRIEEIKNTQQRDYAAERLAREQRIAELEELTSTLRATQQTTEQELEQFGAAINTYRENIHNLSREEEQVNHERRGYQQELSKLEKARKDRMNCFGEWMPKALAAIEAHHRRGKFHKKPLGPLGSYLEITDQRWAVGVEACIGSSLRAFFVHDHHDEQQLQQVLKNVGVNANVPIITSAFQDTLFDVSQNRARCQYPAVIDVINVKVPAVMNCLIDQRGIENIVLIADKEEARSVMLNSPPHKVREAFTPQGDHIYPAPMFRYYSNSSRNQRAQILTSNVEGDIKYIKEKLTECDAKKQQFQVRQRELNAEIGKNNQQAKNCTTRLNRLRDQISKVNMDMRELKDWEDPAPVDITTLEEEAQQIEANLKVLEEKKTAAQGLVEQHKADVKAKEEESNAIGDRLNHIADSTEPFKEQRAQLDDKIVELQGHVSHYKQKRKEHEAKIAGLRKTHEEKDSKLKDNLVKANRLCERIKTRRTPESIETEIKSIKHQIEKHEKEKGNHEEITKKYQELKASYLKIVSEVNQLKNFLQALARVMEQRQVQYCKFRKMIAVRVKIYFIQMLNKREYTGEIKFDHAKEQLTMQVVPNTNHTGEGSKDMRSLSGGERSYATVCFIISLWDAMESPFRCLDEFDVFMDMVNRRMATNMMLEVARDQSVRQFIFLTPLQLTGDMLGPSIGVFRMHDPERGQQTLNFAAVRNGEEEEEMTQ